MILDERLTDFSPLWESVTLDSGVVLALIPAIVGDDMGATQMAGRSVGAQGLLGYETRSSPKFF